MAPGGIRGVVQFRGPNNSPEVVCELLLFC
jgi:hypothetical protein